MDLLLNDLSIEGQFPTRAEFQESIRRILAIRRIVEMSDSAPGLVRRIYCHRNIVNRHIDADASITVYDAVLKMPRDEKVSLLAWFGKNGPYLEDALEEDALEEDALEEDALEPRPGRPGPERPLLAVDDEVVTDTAVGEAAYCSNQGLDRRLVSFAPSQWERSPVTVTMLLDDGDTNIPVENYWTQADLETALQAAEPPISDWTRLEAVCRAKFQRLQFSAECFQKLKGRPFVPAVSDGILRRLKVLDDLMGERDSTGNWRSMPTFQNHFAKSNDRFSDSSDSEKNDRGDQQRLTFPHPDKPGEFLFCPWHGKLGRQRNLYRIHFSWPLSAGEPLYVVHVGEKLTKK